MKTFLLFTWVSAMVSLTWQEYRNIEFIAFNFFNNATKTDSQPGQTTAALLRAVFHDAGTFSRLDGTGGPNGCLLVPCNISAGCDRVNVANKRMEDVIQAVINLYQDPRYTFNQSLSRADFFHLMGKFTVEFATNRTLIIPFQTGRPDCPVQVPQFASRLPSDSTNFAGLQNLFLTRLGFSWTDTVALLGAHTLGRAQRINTKLGGTWDATPATFDTGYYTTLLNNKWSRVTNPAANGFPSKVQWNITGSNSGRFMLTTDIEMVWDPTAQNSACQVTSDSTSCPFQSTTKAIVLSMQTQSTFFSAFSVAFQKLQNNVLDKLSTLTGTDPGFGIVSPGFSVAGRNSGTTPPVTTTTLPPVTTPTVIMTNGTCFLEVADESLIGMFYPVNAGSVEMAFPTLDLALSVCSQIPPCTGVQDFSAFAPCLANRCFTPRALTATSDPGAKLWKRITC